jgi:hypothetical protein
MVRRVMSRFYLDCWEEMRNLPDNQPRPFIFVESASVSIRTSPTYETIY